MTKALTCALAALLLFCGAALAADTAGEWKLVKMVVDGQQTVPGDTAPTLTIAEDGAVNGNASINNYFGQANFGENGALKWQGPPGATMMAGPEELMKQESTFMKGLSSTDSSKVEGDTLTLTGEDGTVLEFRR